MEWDARGMHVHLLNLSWQQQPAGTIPDDAALIRRWLGSPPDDIWRRVSPQVFAAWPIADRETQLVYPDTPDMEKHWGRRVNAGMVRAWDRQQTYKQNGSKPKAKRELHLEDAVEDLNTKKPVTKESPPADSDLTIQKIAALHPKFAKPFETERAIVEQLDRLGDEMGVRNALDYLLTQTKKYRESYEKWTKEDQKHSPESPRWFTSRCYSEPEKNWAEKAAGPHGVDEHGGHFEGNDYITRTGKRMPGYKPPPKAKAKAAD